MALTSNCDFYVAIHDAGINRVVKHIMRQRPSLFNYGTAAINQNHRLLCKDIDIAPEVLVAGNPIVTVLDPLPIIGTAYGLNYLVQLTKGEIDFHPGNVFNLPPELNPPLANQRLAIHFQVCAGVGCPPLRDFPFPLPGRRFPASSTSFLTASRLDQSRITPNEAVIINEKGEIRVPSPPPITVLPSSKLNCFCLDLFATAGAKISGSVGNQTILPFVDGVEIVDLKPEALENIIECYALLALNQGILPTIGKSISTLVFETINIPGGIGGLHVSASTTVPNNPAIENDQLKAFVNLDNIQLNLSIPPTICQSSGGGDGGGGGGGTITRTIRPRTRTGVFDLTAAVSEKAFIEIFGAFIKGFHFSCSDTLTFGLLSATYDVEAHLQGGTIDLTNNGTIHVSELDVKWDTLSLDLCFNIPKRCVGGNCIVPNPFDGCAVRLPEWCFFEGNPDFCIPLDLGGLLTSEISFTAGMKVFYGVGSGVPNRWQIVIVPTLPFDLDIIDIADTVGDLFENLADAAIDTLLGGVPGWAKDLLKALVGDIADFIRFVLDIPDDIGEWLLDILTDLGVFDVLLAGLDAFLLDKLPALEIPDPVTALEADGPLIPVKLPIEFIGVKIDTKEMVITGDIGN